MSEPRRSRRGEGYGACDAADREKGICPLVKFATKVLTTERIKIGENVSVAKTWQERLSQSGKNMAIAKRRICLQLYADNFIKSRDVVR